MSKKKGPKLKQSYFNDLWLDDKRFSKWVRRENDNKVYGCKWCRKSNLKLSNMGKQALLSHTTADSHKKQVLLHHEVQNFFNKHTPSSSSKRSTSSSSSKLSTASSSSRCSSASSSSARHATAEISVSKEESAKKSCEDNSSTIEDCANGKQLDRKKVTKEPMVQTTLETGVEESVKMKACIIWTLTSVMKDFSNRSGDDLHKVFRAMFTDSTIASNFQLGKDKLKYLTN